jgi:tRNA-dihydrouridine synthase
MHTALQHELNRPLSLGGRTIPSRAILAPMAGITHVAFRQILERFGGHGLSYTEMCSARAISHGQKEQHGYFRWTEEERSHLVCQIMGGRPEDLARAAEVIQDLGFFGVDINMGCSVSRICSQGAGAALLREPGRASAAVSESERPCPARSWSSSGPVGPMTPALPRTWPGGLKMPGRTG